MATLDLASVNSDGYKLGIDKEKLAATLEAMAAGLRVGQIHVSKVEAHSIYPNDEWNSGRLIIEFTEKEEG